MTDIRRDPAFTRIVERAVEALRVRERGATPFGRRDFLTAGALAIGGALLAACDSSGPRGAQRLLRYAERKNEGVERLLLRHTRIDHPPAGAALAGDAFPAYFISANVPQWDERTRGPWTLEVSGAVDRPLRLSLDDLLRLRQRRQRVDHFCVEGWTAVADFWGVAVADLARAAGARPSARYVDFQSFDNDYHESWDIESATHPQTLIVYAKDGHFLPTAYGAPARLHSPLKLGYKNVKYLTRLVFMPERNGGFWSDKGYEWYAGT